MSVKTKVFNKIAQVFWPKHGLLRTGRFLVRKVMRIAASPHAIAAGLAAGVLVSFTPFVGLHFFLSFIVAYVVGGNMLAAAIGTAVGNPITFPFIWSGSYALGSQILGIEEGHMPKLSFHDLWNSFESLWPVIKQMLIGGIPMGTFAALVVYGVSYWGIRRFQRKRAAKRALAATAAQS